MNAARSAAGRNAATALAVVVAAGAWAWLFHDKGLVMAEEGQILSEAEAIANGRVLYRDIDGFVAPGVWYLGALLFRIAGPDLDVTRVVMVLLFAATAGVVYLLCREVASPRAAAIALIVLCAQKVLVFPLGVFLFYTEFALFFALAAAYALLRAGESGSRGAALAAGTCLALCALFKQNIGAVSLLGSLAYLAAFERRPRMIAAVLAPPAVAGAGVLAAFGAAGALPALFDGLVRTPFTGFARNFSVPYAGVFSASGDFAQLFHYAPALFVEELMLGRTAIAARALRPLVRALSILIYLAPLAVAVASAWNVAARRPQARVRVLLWSAALATFASAFPRSDFPHVAQGLVGFLPIGAYEMHLLAWPRHVRASGLAAVGLLAALAAALAVAIPHDHRFEHPRAHLWLSEPMHRTLSQGLAFIEESVPRQARLAVIPADAMYYFLDARQPPLRFTIVLAHNVDRDGGQAAADELLRENVEFVLLSEIQMPGVRSFADFAPALSRVLETRFEVVREPAPGEGGPRLLRRRAEPVPPAS